MYALITNKEEEMLSGLSLDISKVLRGEYNVEELIGQFDNFYFTRMILDVTAIKDFNNIVNYQKISIALPVDKIILVLPKNGEVVEPSFISKLISMGYYNFGKTIDDIAYLVEHPNAYKDVAHLHQLEPVAPPVVVGNVQLPNQAIASSVIQPVPVNKIIGVKNVTDNAGATTLVYLMKRELENIHGKTVLAIEVGKREFMYFDDKSLLSVDKKELPQVLASGNNYDVILVDLNDGEPKLCDDVIYLVEPSILKLNKLMRLDNSAFERLKDKKIVLNKTLVSGGNVDTFAFETGVSIFEVIKPLDDRSAKPMLTEFLAKLKLIGDKL